MLVNQPAILPSAFAAEGDKNTIPANNDGLSGLASIAKGFPQITQVPLAQGGQPPQRQDFNGIFNLFSQFLLYAQNGGVYAYNNTLDYQPPCIISYDGEFYSCLQENGPSTSAGVQAPSIATYWEKVIVNSELLDVLDDYATKSDLNLKANIESPTFTGTPKAPTPSSSDNSTRIATTAFVQSALDAEIPAIATTQQLQAGIDNTTIVTPAGLTTARPMKTYTDWSQLGLDEAEDSLQDVMSAMPQGSMFTNYISAANYQRLGAPAGGVITIIKSDGNYQILLDEYSNATAHQRQWYGNGAANIPIQWFQVATTDDLNKVVPVGTILPFAGGTIPSGFLACNGAGVSAATYADLYAAIGNTYGGNSTTFNLPQIEDNRFLEFSSTQGTKNSAGLPNITGGPASSGIGGTVNSDFIWSGSLGTRVVNQNTNSRDGGTSPFYGSIQTAIDASKSSSIYGGSTTVQPKSLTVRAIIKY